MIHGLLTKNCIQLLDVVKTVFRFDHLTSDLRKSECALCVMALSLKLPLSSSSLLPGWLKRQISTPSRKTGGREERLPYAEFPMLEFFQNPYFSKEKDVILTLCESHDFPHLSVLAQQNGQLLYTSILLSARHKYFVNQVKRRGALFFIRTNVKENLHCSSCVKNRFHLPSHHLKLTKTPSPPSTSGIPGLTKKKQAFKCYFGLTVTLCLVNLGHNGSLMRCWRQTGQPC